MFFISSLKRVSPSLSKSIIQSESLTKNKSVKVAGYALGCLAVVIGGLYQSNYLEDFIQEMKSKKSAELIRNLASEVININQNSALDEMSKIEAMNSGVERIFGIIDSYIDKIDERIEKKDLGPAQGAYYVSVMLLVVVQKELDSLKAVSEAELDFIAGLKTVIERKCNAGATTFLAEALSSIKKI